jgi:nucleotide-binding universal stress UspA family protein
VVPQSAHGVVHQTEQQAEMMVEHAQNMIQERFIPTVEQRQAMYKVAIMRGSTDADSIGQHICHSGEQLRAAAVVMAAHNKGKAVKWLVGSTMQYCMHHCHQTLLCMHV